MATFPILLPDGTELLVRCATCKTPIATVEDVELPDDLAVRPVDEVSVEEFQIDPDTEVHCGTCGNIFQYKDVRVATIECARNFGKQAAQDSLRSLLNQAGVRSRQKPASTVPAFRPIRD